ncbi:MAG TPA: hypothetical protein VKQ36_03500, partial [Ktedonobacterales bacterium]|nr:hypothetical protein [Ktedonobacterales bacterium]
GAYDWIDHERLGTATTAGAPAAGAPAVAPRPAAPAGASSPAAGVPDWLSSRNTPRSAGAATQDESTAPVPSVAPRWNDNGYYGPGQQQGQGASQNGQPAQADGDDGKGRNIFRIFSN